jgi:hypothetical protein
MGMGHPRVQQTSAARGRTSWLALEADAASAGLALACAYSSSDEFEAEIIHKRLAAYDEKQRVQRVYLAFFAAAAATIALVYLTA